MVQSIRSNAMTIGQLSRRTGVPIKTLREYERLGFLYMLGRSEGNYRLFGDETLWCVRVIKSLRSLGLTLNEIQGLVTVYRGRSGERIDALLDEHLAQTLGRVEARIADLQALRQRILDYQAARRQPQAQSSASELVRLFVSDPRRGTERATP